MTTIPKATAWRIPSIAISCPDSPDSEYAVLTPYDMGAVRKALLALAGTDQVDIEPGGANGSYGLTGDASVLTTREAEDRWMADCVAIVQDGIENDRRIPMCTECDEEIYEDGDTNWCHISDGARFCERLTEEQEAAAEGYEPMAYPAGTRWLREDGSVGFDWA